MSKFKPSANPTPRRPDFRRIAPEPSRVNSAQASTLDASPVDTSDAVEEVPENAFQKVGFVSTLIFVYLRFSFVHEFIASKFHFNTHLVIGFGALSYLCCFLSGQIGRALRERSTWLWLAFLACMCGASATSFWKGGSLPLLIDYVETVFPVVILIPAVTVTRKQVVKVLAVIGIACMTTVIIGALSDDFKSGRMGMDVQGGDIQDPNDYAAYLLMMLPAVGFLTMKSGRSVVLKIFGFGIFALAAMQILGTGSRGALVGIAVALLYIVFTAPMRIRAAILVGVPVLAMVAVPFIPSQSKERLMTLVSSSAQGKDEEAVESKEARLALLQESAKATLQHPFLGVGPGTFIDYQAVSAQERGQRGMWHVTHNAYTQVSSECGIPALIFYLGALATTFFSLWRVRRSGDPVLSELAYYITISMVVFCACIFFLSLAYTVPLLVLSALTVSMNQALAARRGNSEQEASALHGMAEPVRV